jgi:hypothetical protein
MECRSVGDVEIQIILNGAANWSDLTFQIHAAAFGPACLQLASLGLKTGADSTRATN